MRKKVRYYAMGFRGENILIFVFLAVGSILFFKSVDVSASAPSAPSVIGSPDNPATPKPETSNPPVIGPLSVSVKKKVDESNKKLENEKNDLAKSVRTNTPCQTGKCGTEAFQDYTLAQRNQAERTRQAAAVAQKEEENLWKSAQFNLQPNHYNAMRRALPPGTLLDKAALADLEKKTNPQTADFASAVGILRGQQNHLQLAGAVSDKEAIAGENYIISMERRNQEFRSLTSGRLSPRGVQNLGTTISASRSPGKAEKFQNAAELSANAKVKINSETGNYKGTNGLSPHESNEYKTDPNSNFEKNKETLARAINDGKSDKDEINRYLKVFEEEVKKSEGAMGKLDKSSGPFTVELSANDMEEFLRQEGMNSLAKSNGALSSGAQDELFAASNSRTSASTQDSRFDPLLLETSLFERINTFMRSRFKSKQM